MSLQICPDCGKEVSTAAEACPNCGRPFKLQVERVEPTVYAREETDSIPKWVIFPAVIIVGGLIALLLFMFRGEETSDNTNVNVNVGTEIAESTPQMIKTPNTVQTPTEQTQIPPSTSTDIPQTDNQQTVPTDSQTQIKEPKSDEGAVELEAKVANKNGKVSAVDNEKFYLLDKDLESILREANLKPLENQSLVNSFGLSVVKSDKYGDFKDKALKAINDHVKYDTLTGGGGKGQISNVEPKSYYLFGIHQVGNGFAIWNSPVTIKAGQNKLNIQPQRATEILK